MYTVLVLEMGKQVITVTDGSIEKEQNSGLVNHWKGLHDQIQPECLFWFWLTLIEKDTTKEDPNMYLQFRKGSYVKGTNIMF